MYISMWMISIHIKEAPNFQASAEASRFQYPLENTEVELSLNQYEDSYKLTVQELH